MATGLSSELRTGKILHGLLLAAGGFCWDHRREGVERITVHMNRGMTMPADLRADLKRHGAELKAWVFWMNDQAWQGAPPGLGSPGYLRDHDPMARGGA